MQVFGPSVARCKSALLGVAVGDALGFPFEGFSRGALKDVPLDSFSKGPYPPGTWSDDTSLTFITVESLLERGGLDLDDLAQRFWSWLKKGSFTPWGKAIGVGRATREALERYAKGIAPLQCGGRGERDNGNGGLMRILPVVLWYLRAEQETFLKQIHHACALTHAHPRSLLACGLYGLIFKALLRGKTKVQAVAWAYQEALRTYQEGMFLKELKHFTRLPRLEGLSEEEIRASGYVVHALEAACWVFVHTSSFEEAVYKAVRLGEDTDTTAAIVGGLAGFYYAYVPPKLVNTLVQRDLLEEKAARFCAKVASMAGL